jgi:predicted phage terminase large subunit-like protein
LVIQTRWHTDDLAGWLETESDSGEGDKFEVIRYPALAVEDELYRKKGESLHPERYGREDMLRIKRAVGPRAWSALYQQNPLNDEASYFTQGMFRMYEPPAPRKLGVYAAFDLAVGQREANDYTVGVVIGVDSSDTIYVLDMVRGRWNSLQIVDEIVKLHQRHKPNMIGLEKGQIQLAIGPYLQKRIADDKLWDLAIRDLPTGRRDKQSRARSIQGRMAQGRVKFPKDAPWLPDMMAEMMSFPVGKHDDIVDALAHLGLWLNDMSTPVAHEQGRLPSWRDKLRDFLPATRKTPMSV